MASEQLVILSTVPSQETGVKIAESLVGQGLVACVNIVPGITSVYRWQGAIARDSELLLVIKTSRSAYKAVEQQIVDLHPYELPEVIAVPMIDGLPGYRAWIDSVTGAEE